jgi:hypothetical protein
MVNSKETTRIKKNMESLKTLAKASKTIQRSLLSNASKDLVMTLVQCARLILKGDVQLTERQLNALRPYELMLKRFVASRTPIKERKQLVQQGGFIGMLLKPMIPALLKGLVGGLV